MRLYEISSRDSITQNCVALMTENASVLRFGHFYPIIGSADTPRKNASATGGQFRAINDSYPTNQVAPVFGSVSLKIYGSKLEVDKAYERRGKDIPSERARQLNNFMQELGKNFQYEFFNGKTSTNVKSFNGVRALVPSAQIIMADESGLLIPLGISDAARTTQQKLLEKLRLLINKVNKPDALFMNEEVLSRITTIAAEYIQYTKDDFGNYVPTFAGVPLIPAGYSADGTQVLPQNELFGEYNNASSIIAIKFGEEADLTMATSTGLVIDDLGLVGNHYVYSVEMDADLALLNNKALGMLTGIVLE